jgi:hypothetical protein
MRTVWVLWLGAIVASYAVFQVYAIATGDMMLTDVVREATSRHPVITFLLGALVAWATIHFWATPT